MYQAPAAHLSSPPEMRRKEARDYRPPCMLPAEQSFIQDLLGHMTLIFEERTDNTLSYSIERTLLMSICWSSRNISRNSEKAGSQLTTATWDRMMRFLLRVTCITFAMFWALNCSVR